MKDQCAICYGQILMSDVVGVYLPVVLVTPSARTFQSSSTTPTDSN
jgi:hypothetical protein